MALAPRPKKNNDEVFSLIGMRGALYQLFIEAIAINDVLAKEAAVTFIHQRNIEKYEPIDNDYTLLPEAPEGWACSGCLNGKQLLTPIFFDDQQGKEVVCFLRYEDQWFPYLLTTNYAGMQFPAKMVELFGLTHTTWSDPQAMTAQHLVKAELIDSAEAVLRVPSAVIDFVLTNK